MRGVFIRGRMRRRLREDTLSAISAFGAHVLYLLRNRYIAFATAASVLLFSYYVMPSMWKYIISTLITYFVFTIFMRYSLPIGVFRIKRHGRNVVSDGHAYLLLIFIIIAATILSSVASDYMELVASLSPGNGHAIVAVQTFAILGLLLLDMRFEL